MHDAWNSFASRLRQKLETLKEPTPEWTMDEFKMYLRDYRRLGASTIAKRVSQLGFMELHPRMPVHLHGDRFSLVNSFFLYVRYREDVEDKAEATINDHRAIKALGEFLGIPSEIWPTAPTAQQTDERWIPTPEQVYDLLHASYAPRPFVDYNHHLVKGLLVFDFLIGPRMPSEAHKLQLTDFNPEQHTLVITEPKKSGRRRTLLLEPEWACCSTRHPSLANYLTWRDKVAERSQKAFFLRDTGEPFASKHGISDFLGDRVKPQFPWFYPYLGRHWCANARLIDSGFDYIRVADWLGHEDVNMLRREYEHNSRLHQRLYGNDWLARVARRSTLDPTPREGRPARPTRRVAASQ
jgi:integrase